MPEQTELARRTALLCDLVSDHATKMENSSSECSEGNALLPDASWLRKTLAERAASYSVPEAVLARLRAPEISWQQFVIIAAYTHFIVAAPKMADDKIVSLIVADLGEGVTGRVVNDAIGRFKATLAELNDETRLTLIQNAGTLHDFLLGKHGVPQLLH